MTWQEYLTRFHRERAGVTERVLGRCVDRHGATPYDWLGEPVDQAAPVLDLACGSAPLWPTLAGGHRHLDYLGYLGYLGVDSSAAELSLAADRRADRLVRADAAALPLADGTVGQVVCAMALMLLQPLPQVLTEIARVLRPGGRLAAIVPTGQVRAPRDVAVGAGLVATLGRRLSYPNDAALADLSGLVAAAGLGLVSDRSRRFAYRLSTPDDADALLDSLYLPGVPGHRVRAARAYLHALARIHATVPIPIRRLVAVTSATPNE